MKTLEQYALELREMYGWDEFKALAEARDVEWRRLVEEAQTERDRWKNNNVLVTAEADRLKGELAEFDALSVRLAKELSEARRLLKRCYMGGAGVMDDAIIAFCPPAAPPADAAQGEGAKPVPVGVAIAALAKRVDALENMATSSLSGRRALAARLDELESVAKRIDAEHAELCPQHAGLAATPTPEAAGPVFSAPIPIEPPLPSLSREEMAIRRQQVAGGPISMDDYPEAAEPGPHPWHIWCCAKGRADPVHAVPPIPKGGAR